MKMRSGTVLAFALLSILHGQAAHADACHDRIMEISTAALARYAKEHGIVVAASQMHSVILEIASTLCARTDNAPANLDSRRVGKVMETYVDDFVQYGEASRIDAIVGEVFENKNAIIRSDFRNYGMLTVTCPVPISQSHVDVRDRQEGVCGSVFLVDAGSLLLRLRASEVPICVGDVTISPGQQVTCECQTGLTPGKPVAFACR